MKNYLMYFLVFSIAFLTQCKKDEVNPAYVGTWENTSIENFGGINVNVAQTMIFTKSGWDMDMAVQDPSDDSWMTMMKMGGTMIITGEDAVITITKGGTADKDGNMTIINSGETGFDEMLVAMEMDETFVAKIVVDGNQLTLTIDENEDGEFSVDESMTFTKK